MLLLLFIALDEKQQQAGLKGWKQNFAISRTVEEDKLHKSWSLSSEHSAQSLVSRPSVKRGLAVWT